MVAKLALLFLTSAALAVSDSALFTCSSEDILSSRSASIIPRVNQHSAHRAGCRHELWDARDEVVQFATVDFTFPNIYPSPLGLNSGVIFALRIYNPLTGRSLLVGVEARVINGVTIAYPVRGTDLNNRPFDGNYEVEAGDTISLTVISNPTGISATVENGEDGQIWTAEWSDPNPDSQVCGAVAEVIVIGPQIDPYTWEPLSDFQRVTFSDILVGYGMNDGDTSTTTRPQIITYYDIARTDVPNGLGPEHALTYTLPYVRGGTVVIYLRPV